MISQKPPEAWRRNLYVIWFAQVITVLGFSFIFPFIPLFIQSLGITDPAQAALWSGLAGGAQGLSLMVFGPIWGILGDRYGRKKNVLRALFASSVIVALTGFAANAPQVVLFRFFTGMVSGVFAPAMALVASGTPRTKMGYAMGVFGSAMFVGSTVGPLVGGFLSQAVGFRNTFFVAGGLLVMAGAFVAAFVREDFRRPPEGATAGPLSAARDFWRVATSGQVLPILVVMFLVQVSPVMMYPVLPVLLKVLGANGSAASNTGIAFAVLGVTGFISSIGAARLAERLGLARLMAIACVGAGLMYIPLVFAGTVPLVLLFVGLAGLFQGGLVASTSAMVGVAVPRERHGIAYGAVQSASSMAWGLGPLLGGAMASGFGLRSVFVLSSVAFLATASLATPLVRARLAASVAEEGARAPAKAHAREGPPDSGPRGKAGG